MATNAAELARLAGQLCVLRARPQDFPHAPRLLLALWVAGIVLDGLVGQVLGFGAGAVGEAVLSSVVVLGLCWIALAIRALRHRFVQAAIALLAAGLVFSLGQLLLALLAGDVPVEGQAPTAAQLVAGWAALGLLAWQVGVFAHVMRHAMEAAYGLAFALVVSWVVAYWALDGLLFP